MSKNTGWLKISRGIVNHWLWEDANRLKWWLDLLLMAAYETKSVYVNTRLVEIRRGQMVASLSFLCQRWGISKPTLLVFLKLLESEGMIERSLDHNISVLTICNYESYQSSDKDEVDNVLDNPLDNPKEEVTLDNLFDNETATESKGCKTDGVRPLDNLFDNPLDNLLYTSKENKEYTTTTNNSASEKEAKLFEDMRSNDVWQTEAICMKFKISKDECLRRIDEFELDCKCQNRVHVDRRDIYYHFANWLRIKQEIERKNESIRQKPQDKRRGSEVTASSAEDYSTSF